MFGILLDRKISVVRLVNKWKHEKWMKMEFKNEKLKKKQTQIPHFYCNIKLFHHNFISQMSSELLINFSISVKLKI